MAANTFAAPAERVEATPRRIRVRAGDTVVADSRRAQLLVRYGRDGGPTYLLPPQDVRTDLLTGSGDLRVDGRVLEGVARRFGDDGPDGTAGLWTFAWDAARRLVRGGDGGRRAPRDPKHRVDAVPSDRRVVVEIGGEVIADSRRPQSARSAR